MLWEKKILLLGETKWCRREASAAVGVALMSPEGEKYCCCYYARLLRWEPHIRVPWRSWAYLAASFPLVVIDAILVEKSSGVVSPSLVATLVNTFLPMPSSSSIGHSVILVVIGNQLQPLRCESVFLSYVDWVSSIGMCLSSLMIIIYDWLVYSNHTSQWIICRRLQSLTTFSFLRFESLYMRGDQRRLLLSVKSPSQFILRFLVTPWLP